MELTAASAEDVADLRAILRLIETGALHEVTEAIDCLDTLLRDQIPIRHYDAVVVNEENILTVVPVLNNVVRLTRNDDSGHVWHADDLPRAGRKANK